MESKRHHNAAAGGSTGGRAAAGRRAERRAEPRRRFALKMSRSRARLCSSHLIWAAATLAIAIAGCTYAIVNGNRVDRAKSERIYRAVETMRGLSFRREVPLVVMSSEGANAVMEREVSAHRDDVALERAAEVGAMTGLYAPGTDLKAQTMQLLASQVAGFYDPEDREMILIEGHEPHGLMNGLAGFFRRSDPDSEMLIAHELTHSLQDQHFDIHQALDRIRDNDDRQQALKAVAEGDATLAAYGYVKGRLDPGTIAGLLSHLEDMPRLVDAESPGTPEALRDSLVFQYADGTHFVSEAYLRGGWVAVNALYAKPPTSTRQVIEPAAYFDHPSPPVSIVLNGWQRALKGWRPVEQNTYGELHIRVILRRNPSDDAQVSLARGWRGDRMVVLQSGSALTVIWIVVLRDQETAADFARVYSGILDRISTGGLPLHRVDRRDDAVLIAIGPGANYFRKFAPAVWRDTVISGDVTDAASPESPGRAAAPTS
jgi:hypothetical protein